MRRVIRDVRVLSVRDEVEYVGSDDDVKYPGSSVGNFGDERRLVVV